MKASLSVIVAVALSLVGVTWVGAQAPKDQPKEASKAATKPQSLFPAGYADHETISSRLRGLAAGQPQTLQVQSLAKTREGRDVWLATFGHGTTPKPAVLVVGNLEADHLVGSQVAIGLIERLAKADGKDAAVTKLLDEHTVYVVPRLNPDGAERLLKGSPKTAIRTNLTAVDRDRDGRENEDGPNDIDNDGFALTMRVKDSKATLVADAKDARILRKAETAKGERAVYSEMTEGIDDDQDGSINEDPAGGVNLNRNWPHGWTEYNPETGFSPASEPEVNALIRFAFAHPEINAVWTFSLNDNLRSEAKNVAPTDAPYFAELTRVFNNATGAKEETAKKAETPKAEVPKAEPAKTETPPAGRGPVGKGQGRGPGGGRGGAGGAAVQPAASAAPAPTSDGTTDGAMNEWAYQQFGVIGLGSRLWSTPEGATGEGEARWLDWNDKIMNGQAFVPFHTVDHPTLGKVEVGGWKPGVRLNPPSESIAAITDGCYVFLKDLTGKLPALKIKETKVTSKGGGVFEIVATIENTGYLPTALAQGLTTRRTPPVLVKLGAGKATLLGGRALNRIDTLAGSGGSREFRWLVLAPEDVKTVTLEASSARTGAVRTELPLR